ncbi:unnamed protein product [Didymodactylos carnosus]|uniref:Uncharacterized protein n=1 Tax=Didymodactylos carnosus TaxID=1234261 RepID=A0A815M3H7_9BILA|nr:unnamed protein product [Didymodactylos carnosus]CAF4303324.1 unnamed protein product [Didymodactylos carnosus]
MTSTLHLVSQNLSLQSGRLAAEWYQQHRGPYTSWAAFAAAVITAFSRQKKSIGRSLPYEQVEPVFCQEPLVAASIRPFHYEQYHSAQSTVHTDSQRRFRPQYQVRSQTQSNFQVAPSHLGDQEQRSLKNTEIYHSNQQSNSSNREKLFKRGIKLLGHQVNEHGLLPL